MNNYLKWILLIALCMPSSLITAQTGAQFIDLGSGGAAKVSNNGIYVCGNNYPAPGFLWTEAGGRITLGTGYTEAMAVSNDGIVSGSYRDENLPDPYGHPTFRGGFYQNNTWNPLPGYPGYPILDSLSFTYADGISADGSVIVGMQWVPGYKAEAVYWDSTRSIHLLGRTGGGSSRANDVAVIGSSLIIAGWDGEANGPDRRAFYWDPQPHYMGGYDTTYPVGQCFGLNSDGSKIVGGSAGAPFVWSASTGMVWITTDYINYASYAKDISDNDIIVGYVSLNVGNYQAFIKKPGWNDIMFFKDYLIDSLGITGISDWYFPFVNSISADGSVMVGTAYPPSGGPNAYVVKIDNFVPVELSSFTAEFKDNIVSLRWSTATETNNKGFELQRKTESSGWSSIAFIKGHGTTTESFSYSFTDNSVNSGKYFYRLKQIDFDGTISYSKIIDIDINKIFDFSLEQNYPNPFNPVTKISFSIPRDGMVNLSVYNVLGEKVAVLVDEIRNAGNHSIDFNASELASGIYVYRLQAGSYIATKKMMLIK